MKLRFQFSKFRPERVEFRMSLFNFTMNFIEANFNSILHFVKTFFKFTKADFNRLPKVINFTMDFIEADFNFTKAVFNRFSKVIKSFEQCFYRRLRYVLAHR